VGGPDRRRSRRPARGRLDAADRATGLYLHTAHRTGELADLDLRAAASISACVTPRSTSAAGTLTNRRAAPAPASTSTRTRSPSFRRRSPPSTTNSTPPAKWAASP
jgi:hypothetical protein